MSFFEKFQAKTPTLSFEVFPPKNPSEWGLLYSTLGEISQKSPDFVSVTYRGGVSTRERTVELVGRIQRELAIETVAHLTCITHTREVLSDILSDLERSGITNIIALRGDRPKKRTLSGLEHATDLINLAKERGTFRVACAFYPEKHPEAASFEEDISFLKYKQDCGADYAISQFFFDNGAFYRFRDLAVRSGVTLPLIAGILPVSSLNQLRRFRQLSGTGIPAKLTDFLGEGSDDVIVRRGIDFGRQQCEELLQNDIAGIHLYTLNRSSSSVCITDGLRSQGYFQSVVE